jgi:hypothetical protein
VPWFAPPRYARRVTHAALLAATTLQGDIDYALVLAVPAIVFALGALLLWIGAGFRAVWTITGIDTQ